MVETPNDVRHYWRAARQPFLNLSDLDDSELEQVIGELGDERSAGESHRVFGRHGLSFDGVSTGEDVRSYKPRLWLLL